MIGGRGGSDDAGTDADTDEEEEKEEEEEEGPPLAAAAAAAPPAAAPAPSYSIEKGSFARLLCLVSNSCKETDGSTLSGGKSAGLEGGDAGV